MPTWLRNPAGVMILVAVLLGSLGTITLVSEIGRPFGGYASALQFQSRRTVLVGEIPLWWPIYQAGVAPSEVVDLISVNGRSHQHEASEVFEEAWAVGDTSVTLHLYSEDANRSFDVLVPVIPFSLTHLLEIKLPDLIIGLCFLLTAIVVLKARPSAALNQTFAIATALVATHRWMAIQFISVDSRMLPTILIAIYMMVTGLVQPAILHFALLFPTPVKPWPRRLVILAYVCGGAAGLIMTTSRILISGGLNDPVVFRISNAAFTVVEIIYLVALVVLLGRLASLWLRHDHSRRERRMGLIVFLSLVAALPVLLTFAGPILPGLSKDQSRFLFGLDLRYLLLAVPLALAFIIVRYQSMRSPSRLLVLVIVIAGSALLAAIGSWLWGLSQENWPASGEHPPFPYLFAGIFLASAFWSTQANWRGWFGRLLEWDTHSYEATRAFGRRVSGATHPGLLAGEIAEALVSELQLDRAAVWLWDMEQRALALASAAGQPSPALPEKLTPIGQRLPEANRPLRLDTPVVPAWLEPLAGLGAVDVVIPLQSDGRPIGLLGLGHRWDEEVFDDRDLVIAELIGQQAALFLLAAMQVQELRRVPQRIVDAQEQERLRLAGELHDTVQQFLGRLPFALAVSRDDILADPDGTAESLSRCLDDTEDMAETVRRIRFNLAPYRLESSLIRSLEDLVDRARRRSGLDISLSAGEELDAATNLSTRWALYRVIQQALENTIQHAGATRVSVRLTCENDRVTFIVADNGRGFTEEERLAARARGRFGMVTMRARMELAGGELSVVSVPGEGTTVSGRAPVTAGPE